MLPKSISVVLIGIGIDLGDENLDIGESFPQEFADKDFEPDFRMVGDVYQSKAHFAGIERAVIGDVAGQKNIATTFFGLIHMLLAAPSGNADNFHKPIPITNNPQAVKFQFCLHILMNSGKGLGSMSP